MSEQSDAGIQEASGESIIGTEDFQEQPAQQDSSVGEPQTGAEPTEEIGPEHKSYKEIQSAFSRKTEELKELQQKYAEIEKKFQPYGGADNLIQQAQQLVSDPEFTKWAQTRGQNDMKSDIYSQFGIDPSNDPETAQTVDAVMKITESIVNQKLEQKDREHQQELSQIKNQVAQDKVRGYLSQLRQTPGYEKVDELREEMMKASDLLAPEKRTNPNYEDLQDLYWMAARRKGMFEELQANAYQKRLESKKQKSLDKPSSSKSGAQPTDFNNLKDALNAAKKAHGVSELKF